MYDFFPSYSLTIMSTSDSNCLYLSPLFLFTSFHPFSSPCIPPLLLNTLFYDFVIHPIVNFINIKRTNFSYERMFWQLLLHTCKAAKMTFVRKTRTFYVDEIDTRSQSYRLILSMINLVLNLLIVCTSIQIKIFVVIKAELLHLSLIQCF